jgi:hypothetical protein
MGNLTTPEDVADYMRQATSKDDWTLRAGHVQDANGGVYPEFWHATIIASGVLGSTSRNWPGRPVG